MRDSNQLHESVGGRDLRGVGLAIQSVAGNCLAARRKLPLRARPDQRADFVSALQQLGDQRTADVSRTAGDEDAMILRIHRLRSGNNTQMPSLWIASESGRATDRELGGQLMGGCTPTEPAMVQGQVRDCSGTLSRSAAPGILRLRSFPGPCSPIEAEAL